MSVLQGLEVSFLDIDGQVRQPGQLLGFGREIPLQESMMTSLYYAMVSICTYSMVSKH